MTFRTVQFNDILHLRNTHFITLLSLYSNNPLAVNSTPTTVNHICIKQFNFIHSSHLQVTKYLNKLILYSKRATTLLELHATPQPDHKKKKNSPISKLALW